MSRKGFLLLVVNKKTKEAFIMQKIKKLSALLLAVVLMLVVMTG